MSTAVSQGESTDIHVKRVVRPCPTGATCPSVAPIGDCGLLKQINLAEFFNNISKNPHCDILRGKKRCQGPTTWPAKPALAIVNGQLNCRCPTHIGGIGKARRGGTGFASVFQKLVNRNFEKW